MDAPPPAAERSRIALAFATCTLIWGSTFLVIRIGNDTVPPMWAATLRLTIAAAILIAMARFGGHGLPRGEARRAAAAYGFFLFGLNVPLLYWGETAVSSGLAAVVYATGPITNALVARAFGLERLVPAKLVAAVVALAGVALLFVRELGAPVTALPLFAIYLATLASAVGAVMLKRGPRQSPIGANAIANLVGAPMCLLFAIAMREPLAPPTRWPQFAPILYLAIAGSVGAFVAIAWLIQRVDVSTTGFIGVVVPLIAITLGVLVRHERFEREHVIGSLLVIAGVALAIASDRRRAQGARPARTGQAPSSATE
jgi:drug/metabolite transporter (DMT)-like permease